MSFRQYQDEFGRTITEGLLDIKEVEVTHKNVIDTEAIDPDIFGLVVKRLPISAKIKINGKDPITIDEGDKISPFILTIDSIQIVTNETITDPIVIQFLI